MTSVRLRLLILAFAPMVVLMPLLLFLGLTRWTADYDRVLIANVESDLRIAEQYLARIMDATRDDLLAISESAAFARHLGTGQIAQYLSEQRSSLGLDFLYYLPDTASVPQSRWPVIAAAQNGQGTSQIDLFTAQDLVALSPVLAGTARIDLIKTEAAVPTERLIENRGMVVHAASPVHSFDTPDQQRGVLVGGILLNRNLDFIDAINALVYLNAVTGGERQGTATLFLDDVRISTNVRLFEDVRALGTRVSAAVRGRVLDEGRTWLDRAFVVNDWYVSGYLPLTDSFGKRVGMLYVGFLEAPFVTAKKRAFWWMLAAFAAVLALSTPVFLWLAKGIFAPLEQMTKTMRRVGRGDLSARNANVRAQGEIAQVAGHLDDLLDQVQDRDRRLRSWADELNDRVEERTSELRAANDKLEQTYRQLMMSEKLASIGEITAGVAHEINNPVAVIQGNVDVMRDVLGPHAAPVETEFRLVDQQIGRIRAMVGKLLQFARPSDFAAVDHHVSLEAIIDDCLVLVEHAGEFGEIAVVKQLSPVPDVCIDAGEMQQVVINLLMNAAHAIAAHSETGTVARPPTDAAEAKNVIRGHVYLTLTDTAKEGIDGVSLEIRDTGPGIPPDQVGTVFDPFFTTKQAEGTGLGLSISQTLVQGAGGIIAARNHPEGGAVFTIWLPAAQT